jgi:hypothetical protein
MSNQAQIANVKNKSKFLKLFSHFKIPPNLPFPKGGEIVSPFEKGGLRGILR